MLRGTNDLPQPTRGVLFVLDLWMGGSSGWLQAEASGSGVAKTTITSHECPEYGHTISLENAQSVLQGIGVAGHAN